MSCGVVVAIAASSRKYTRGIQKAKQKMRVRGNGLLAQAQSEVAIFRKKIINYCVHGLQEINLRHENVFAATSMAYNPPPTSVYGLILPVVTSTDQAMPRAGHDVPVHDPLAQRPSRCRQVLLME